MNVWGELVLQCQVVELSQKEEQSSEEGVEEAICLLAWNQQRHQENS